jgi:L-lactate dehydrogenase complex protein LldG
VTAGAEPAGAARAEPAGAARAEILARVRASLVGATGPPPVPRDYRRAGSSDPAALIALLADRLAAYRAGVRRVQPEDVAGAVAEALAGTGTVVVPADAPGAWLSRHLGRVRRDSGRDPVPVAELDAPGVSVLTGCAAAIAETGTILLDAGAAQGRRALTLVPDHHVCVVRAQQVVATVPEGLARLTDPTRPLTLISGPSATSDIELNRVEGVHGPRRLVVIIVG